MVQQVPTEGGSITASDSQGDQTIITIPQGAISSTISLAYTPIDQAAAPGGFSFAGSGFDLSAYQEGVLLDNYVFQAPITLTLNYSDADIVHMEEDSLRLDYWDPATGLWIDAATTCSPASNYSRFPEDNYLTVSVCHLSRFALFGKNQYLLYAPVVCKSP
jgi:hypothetical protein